MKKCIIMLVLALACTGCTQTWRFDTGCRETLVVRSHNCPVVTQEISLEQYARPRQYRESRQSYKGREYRERVRRVRTVKEPTHTRVIINSNDTPRFGCPLIIQIFRKR